MPLTTNDIKGIVTDAVDELAGLVKDGFERVERRFQHVEQRLDNIDQRLDRVERRLDVLDIFKLSDFRDLVRLLAMKNVLTAEEAAKLHVHVDRPAA